LPFARRARSRLGVLDLLASILTSLGFTAALDMGFPLNTEAGYQALIDRDCAGKLLLRVK